MHLAFKTNKVLILFGQESKIFYLKKLFTNQMMMISA